MKKLSGPKYLRFFSLIFIFVLAVNCLSTVSLKADSRNLQLLSKDMELKSRLNLQSDLVHRSSLSTANADTLNIIAQSLKDGSTKVGIDDPFVIWFDTNIAVDSSTASQIILTADGVNYDVTAEVNNTMPSALVIKSTKDLPFEASCTLTINSGAVKDTTGAMQNSQIVINFKTMSEFTRLSGNNRYDTNVAVCKQGWDTAKTIVIASGEDYPDALCAGPLANILSAPVVLSEKKGLPDTSLSEIKSLGVQQVYIVGGESVLSANVEAQLNSAIQGLKIHRISGSDRYDTSAQVASIINTISPVSKIAVACGSGYADALSIASYAAYNNIPILLTMYNKLPDTVAEFINTNPEINGSIVVGGTNVISNVVYASLPGTSTTDLSSVDSNSGLKGRFAGDNRYETNKSILLYLPHDYSYTFLASGENFPDALSASALAGNYDAPIILIDDALPQNMISFLSYNKDIMKMKLVIGGQIAVSDTVITKVFPDYK